MSLAFGVLMMPDSTVTQSPVPVVSGIRTRSEVWNVTFDDGTPWPAAWPLATANGSARLSAKSSPINLLFRVFILLFLSSRTCIVVRGPHRAGSRIAWFLGAIRLPTFSPAWRTRALLHILEIRFNSAAFRDGQARQRPARPATTAIWRGSALCEHNPARLLFSSSLRLSSYAVQKRRYGYLTVALTQR